MLGDDYQKSALWKQLMRLVADAHGYADAVIKAQEATGMDSEKNAHADTPRDHAGLCKQLLTQSVELAQAVAADARLDDPDACRVVLEEWSQRARRLDAIVEMMGVVGLFKPRSLRRTRRGLAGVLAGFEASAPVETSEPLIESEPELSHANHEGEKLSSKGKSRRKIVRKVTKKKTPAS